jgi:hypothetical protein
MIYPYIPYLYGPLSIPVLSLPKNIQKPISDVLLKPPAAEAHQLSPVAPRYGPGAGSVRSPSGDHLGDVIWIVWSDLQHPYIYIYYIITIKLYNNNIYIYIAPCIHMSYTNCRIVIIKKKEQ